MGGSVFGAAAVVRLAAVVTVVRDESSIGAVDVMLSRLKQPASTEL